MSIQQSGPSARELIEAQIQMVEKIIDDEVWYEGERRQCQVDRNDLTVKRRVNQVIMECGHEMRERAKRMLMKQEA